MIPEVVRYLATVGAATVVGGLFSLLRLAMRQRFHRYVIDRATAQGQPIDAVEIIKITTPGASSRHQNTTDGGMAKIDSADQEADPPPEP